MKAIIKKSAEPDALSLEEIPVPNLENDQVLVKIKKTAICGTDVHIYNWDSWAQRVIRPPMVIGHEFVGEVVEIGRNVTNVRPGDLVSGEGHVVCGKCRHCITLYISIPLRLRSRLTRLYETDGARIRNRSMFLNSLNHLIVSQFNFF